MTSITIHLNEDTNLGERLARARTIAGMSQAELGERIGRNFVTISNYEHGNVQKPAFDVIVLWASATAMPLDYFANAIDGYTPPDRSDPNDRQGLAKNAVSRALPFPHVIDLTDRDEAQVLPMRHHEPVPYTPAA